MSKSRFFNISDLLKDREKVTIGSVSFKRVPHTQTLQDQIEMDKGADILISLRGKTFSAEQLKDRTISHHRPMRNTKR